MKIRSLFKMSNTLKTILQLKSWLILIICASCIRWTDSIRFKPSPCPGKFNYESTTNDDRWYGDITFPVNTTIDGSTIRIELDRPSQLLTTGGPITTKDNQVYFITHDNVVLEKGSTYKLIFMVKFDKENEVPMLATIHFNGQRICPPDLVTLSLGGGNDYSSSRPDIKATAPTDVLSDIDKKQKNPTTKTTTRATYNNNNNNGGDTDYFTENSNTNRLTTSRTPISNSNNFGGSNSENQGNTGYNPNSNSNNYGGGSTNGNQGSNSYNPNGNSNNYGGTGNNGNQGSNGYNPNSNSNNYGGGGNNGNYGSGGYNPNTSDNFGTGGNNGYNPNTSSNSGSNSNGFNNNNNQNQGNNGFGSGNSNNYGNNGGSSLGNNNNGFNTGNQGTFGGNSDNFGSNSNSNQGNNGFNSGNSNNGFNTGSGGGSQGNKNPNQGGEVIFNNGGSTNNNGGRPNIGNEATVSGEVACGTVSIANPLITLAQNSEYGQWPWHVALFMRDEVNPSKSSYICGGSLVSKNRVITAAHCVSLSGNRIVNPNSLTAYMGKYNINTDESTSQKRTVSALKVNPEYNKANFHNDIAILSLKDDVEFTNYVRPICLWEATDGVQDVVGQNGIVVGWGYNEYQQLNQELKQATMPIVSTEKCARSDPQFFSEYVSDNAFCAGSLNGTGPCKGDSGGGLVLKRNNSWYLRGIVSVSAAPKNGSVCNNHHYIVFTDTAKYTDFIKRNI
ncbi:putative uncharacterized protein DDB_G0282133 isoform X2 [Planococcus citri]|uniref:putative uncharacterized protein DDB_G0282133 isoform X2 n=1 Tax=Planococcus citri TaxID=170843 RepID=UPI0031F7BBA4